MAATTRLSRRAACVQQGLAGLWPLHKPPTSIYTGCACVECVSLVSPLCMPLAAVPAHPPEEDAPRTPALLQRSAPHTSELPRECRQPSPTHPPSSSLLTPGSCLSQTLSVPAPVQRPTPPPTVHTTPPPSCPSSQRTCPCHGWREHGLWTMTMSLQCPCSPAPTLAPSLRRVAQGGLRCSTRTATCCSHPASCEPTAGVLINSMLVFLVSTLAGRFGLFACQQLGCQRISRGDEWGGGPWVLVLQGPPHFVSVLVPQGAHFRSPMRSPLGAELFQDVHVHPGNF